MCCVALLAVAWSVVLVRDEHIGYHASHRLFDTRQPLRPGLARLDDANLLNPDTKWRVQSAQYLRLRDKRQEAMRAAEAILRGEPANINAWGVVFEATQDSDPRRAEQALEAIRRLDPRRLRR